MPKPVAIQIPEGLEPAVIEAIKGLDLSEVQDLEAAEVAVTTEATALADTEDPSVEQLDRLDALVELNDRIRAEGAERTDEVQKRRDRAAAAKAKLAGPADEAEGDDTEGDEGDDAEGDEDGPGDEAGDESGDDEGEDTTEAQEAIAAAAAAKARRRSPSLIRARGESAPIPTPKRAKAADSDAGITITASAGIRGVEAGSELKGFDALVEAFQARAGSHPTQMIKDQYMRHPVASISRGIDAFDGASDLNEDFNSDPLALADFAADESRLVGKNGKGGSLAAAGGWCAPSETLYDFVSLETTDGLFDGPEVQVRRGGLNLTEGPDFAAIYAGSGFSQTEAQAIAGLAKNCYEVECPEFEETRLEAVGLCIKSGLLTNSAYPELLRRVLAGALVAHQHKMSIMKVNAIAAELGTPVVVPSTGSVARSTLTGLELAAEGQREQYRMARNATMEVVLPNWVRVVLRDDLQARTRSVEPVTDAQIDAHFAARKLRVQFIYGFGDARIVAVPGGGTLLTDFPDTYPALMFPAGTFIIGVHDVINLDTVYDSTDLEVNVFTAAFIEESLLVARRAPGGGRLTMPVVSKGSVGPADLPAYGIADV